MTSAELHKGQLYCLWLLCLTGVFLCARALQRGHHLPDQRLGLHFRQCTVTDFHTVRALVLYWQHKEMGSHRDPCNQLTPHCVTDGLRARHFHTWSIQCNCSSFAFHCKKNGSLISYKPVIFQTLEKPMNFLYRSVLSHVHALDCSDCSNSCIWNIHGCQFL